jgi:hypothetical protein
LAVPNSFWNKAGLAFRDVQPVLLGLPKVGSEENINDTIEEVQQFVLFGMHFPLVPHSRGIDWEDTDLPPIKFHREELNRRRSSDNPSGLRYTHFGSVSIGYLAYPALRGQGDPGGSPTGYPAQGMFK